MRRRMHVAIAIGMLCACAPGYAPGRAWAAEDAGSASEGAADAGGPPRIEHLAWSACGFMYLNGPRLEAMTPGRGGAGLSDDDGNVYWGTRYLNNETDAIMTITDDYWQTDFGIDEGPASAFSSYEPYQIAGATFCRFVSGRPLEDGGKGALWFGDFRAGEVKKLYRNPDRDNRWWFERIAGGGTAAPPDAKGRSIPAREADLHGDMMIQVMPDDRVIIFHGGNFYEYKDGTLVCLLGIDDYKATGPKVGNDGEPERAKLGVMGGDGVFYLGTYFGSGFGCGGPAVWRVTADGKASPYVWGRYNKHKDGDAMYTGYFCGPTFWAFMHNYRYIPADTLLLCAFDDNYLRRVRDGRLSTLCPDGEFRELDGGKGALRWFRWMRGNQCSAPGPGGTAVVPLDPVCKTIAYRVTNIDYDRPVTGPRLPIPTEPSDADKRKRSGDTKRKKNGKGKD